ncbi:MAG: deoxyguanosinetriphosphate triphosphohydrolase [Kiloniellales bacterium]|nr:deoxyguanosinetriphosphate triphosphohydrolase [Kiloniellales bacterium]
MSAPRVLAPYASHPEKSRGRLYPQSDSATRTAFQRDRDRIIHSTAFRRLQYKTQVFVYHEGDHYRTRLTHSIEVAQIARSVARALDLNEDLAEAIALAHDLGHTPFGHGGEGALDAAMADFGGFDHNEQTFRILTVLERRYAAFDGLNLTWESLEGTVKHNGPLIADPRAAGGAVSEVPESIAAFTKAWDLELASYAGPEAQVAALADDIAYNNHDIDDGLRAGLFEVGDLAELPLVGAIFAEVRRSYPNTEEARQINEAVRRLIDHMVNDLVSETRGRLAQAKPCSAEEVRGLGAPVVAFSEEMRKNDRALRDFLFARMYRHDKVNRKTEQVQEVVRALFAHYLADPRALPVDWQAGAGPAGSRQTARVAADYIAGMTDRFALGEHRKLQPGESKRLYE